MKNIAIINRVVLGVTLLFYVLGITLWDITILFGMITQYMLGFSQVISFLIILLFFVKEFTGKEKRSLLIYFIAVFLFFLVALLVTNVYKFSWMEPPFFITSMCIAIYFTYVLETLNRDMVSISLETTIASDIKTVFDLSRSIDLHLETMSHTNEIAIAGKTSGLIELNETVTWQAKHFGITQKLTSKVTQLKAPYLFVDEMVEGAFKSFIHTHYYKEKDGFTTMSDTFTYESPYGILGNIANWLFLESYMTKLLEKRNRMIKQCAEK